MVGVCASCGAVVPGTLLCDDCPGRQPPDLPGIPQAQVTQMSPQQPEIPSTHPSKRGHSVPLAQAVSTNRCTVACTGAEQPSHGRWLRDASLHLVLN